MDKKIIGYSSVLLGCVFAPLLPFFLLLLFPFIAILCDTVVIAVLFAILADLFLLPPEAPLSGSLLFYTALVLPFYAYLRYTTTL